MGTGKEIFTSLGLTPERVVAYAYAGLFVAFAGAIVDPVAVKRLVDSLGGFLSTLVTLALGVAVYVFHRQVLGELFLYHVHHLIHRGLDFLAGRSGNQLSSSTAYLGYLGVPLGSRRNAYGAIREVFLDEETKRRLDLAHGELHVLNLTAVGCLAVGLLRLFGSGRAASLPWIVAGIVTYAGALVGEIRQHSLETRMLKSLDYKSLMDFLLRTRYVGTDIAARTPQNPG